MRKIIVATAFAGVVLAGIGAGTASADQPVVKGCAGESVSANARALHPYGQVVLSPNAPRNLFGSIGDAVAAIKAGLVDDSIYLNTCN